MITKGRCHTAPFLTGDIMDTLDTLIRVSGVMQDSIVDGPGLRYVLFTQGCYHNCKGCHNPETHSFEGGKLVTVKRLLELLDKNPLTQGVTLSGGEPFEQPAQVAIFAKEVKKRGLHLMCYSGYTFEQLVKKGETDPAVAELLSCLDTLVDGKFILEQRSLNLLFRGSRNQRILDVPASLQSGIATVDTKITGREDAL